MELWKTIPEFPDYAVSNAGRVKRLTPACGTQAGRIMKLCWRSRYLSASFHKHTCRKVHRLVAQAFIPNPLNLPEVNHKNPGEKFNNTVDNLEWVTSQGNTDHALAHGLRQKPHSRAKHIYKHGRGWRVIIQEIRYGTFRALQAAKNMRDSVLSQKECF